MTGLVLPVLGETLDAKPPEYSSKMGKKKWWPHITSFVFHLSLNEKVVPPS